MSVSKLLRDDVTSVMRVRSQDELLHEVLRFARRLGFDLASAIAVQDRLDGGRDCFSVENTPAGYQEMYLDPRSTRVDPVCQHCRRHSTPIVWNQQTYVEAGQASKWEYQSAFGYGTGLAIAIHLKNGLHLNGRRRQRPATANVHDRGHEVGGRAYFVHDACDRAGAESARSSTRCCSCSGADDPRA